MTERGLEARQLVRAYGGRRVVDRVGLQVGPGEVVGLLGPNGAGKSTTFGMVMGLVRPDEGQVRLEGKDVTTLPLHRRARLGLGYLAQEPSVFRGLSVRDNLMAVLELRRDLTQKDRGRRADALMEEFDLGLVATTRGEHLSGGERRRVEIARCLAMDPKIILLDEPFAGIDPLAVIELRALIARLESEGFGLLITDHNARETLGICRRAYVIVEGRIVCEGLRDEVVADSAVRSAYLGADFSLR